MNKLTHIKPANYKLPYYFFLILVVPISCFADDLTVDFSDEEKINFKDSGSVSIYSIKNNDKEHFFNLKLKGVGTKNESSHFKIPVMQISKNTVTYKWDEIVSETWKWRGNLLQRFITIHKNPSPAHINNLTVFSPYETDLDFLMVSSSIFLGAKNNTNLRISQNLNRDELFDADCLPIDMFKSYGGSSNILKYSYKNTNINYPITFYHDFEINTDYKKPRIKNIALDDNNLAITYDYDLVKLYEKKNGEWLYTTSITPIVPINSSKKRYEGNFGMSLTIDNNTLIIGASNEPNHEISNRFCIECLKGTVYIYVKNHGKWTLQSQLFGIKNINSTSFGDSVDLDGDDLVVGDPSSLSYHIDENNNEIFDDSYPGAVYLFKRTNNEWQQTTFIKPLDIKKTDSFGTSVTIDNGTIAIGGITHDKILIKGKVKNPQYAISHGLVYVYERENNNWVRNDILKKKPLKRKRNNHKIKTYYPNYGSSISIDNNVLVVGNPSSYFGSEKGYFLNSDPENKFTIDEFGGVDIYIKKRKNWKKQTSLTSSVPFDNYGSRVKIVNNTLLIGASGDNNDSSGIHPAKGKCHAPSSGAIEIYQRSKKQWKLMDFVKSPEATAFEYFGQLLDFDDQNLVIVGDKPYLYSVESDQILQVDVIE